MSHELDDLAFLSSAALRLGEIGPEEDIFQFVAEQLALLAPHTIVITNSYEPSTGSVIARALVGPPDMTSLVAEGNVPNPLGLAFRVDDEGLERMAECKLKRIEGGLHQLTFHTWPAEVTGPIEARLGLRSVYGQRFTTEKGGFLGTAAFLSQAPALENERLIEAFTRLAAVAIQRQSAEAKLRESEHRFRMLAENSRDVIFRLRLDPTPVVEYVSHATTRLIGHTPEEVYADPRLGEGSIYPADWRSPHPRGQLLPSEYVVAHCRRDDGAYLWIEQSVRAIQNVKGDIVALEGVARDITKRKEAEDALLEADRRKTDFLAVLSHELRNPLGSIRNGVHVLGLADPAGDRASRARAVVDRQITHLARLIDDLLDVTRITRGKIQLHRERFELNEMVRATVEDDRSTFERGHVDVEVLSAPSEVWIDADRTRIAQILDNLLQNAAKFTPPSGKTTVSVSTDTATSQAVLRVHNTGASIAADLLPHLFEPFVQADRTLDRSKGGLGLGLALVKGLVDLHSGSVAVESDSLQGGTAFTIRLPLDATSPATVHPSDVPVPLTAPSRRVLVIEDNVDAADSLRDALELHDNTVAVAGSGPEGIETARVFRPDVVICDIGLPGMDGYSVARAMRADPELRDISLIALTGYASPDDIATSREAGFDRHVAKPPSFETLERVMAEVVGL